MSAATNTLLLVEQQLWTIVLAWPGLTGTTPPLLKIGNAIRFDGNNGWPDATKVRRAPADAVEFKLEIGAGRPDPKGPRTFCLQPDVTIVPFNWTLTASDKRYQAITQAMAELKASMINTDTGGGAVAAGVQLGLSAIVARWDWSFRPGTPSPQENVRQIVVTQSVTIKG